MRYEREFFILAVAVYAAGIFLDAGTTIYGVGQLGFVEMNGWMAFLFSEIGVVQGMMIGKLVATVFLVLGYFMLRNVEIEQDFNHLTAFSSIVLISGCFYLFAGLHNLRLISLA